jgi:hypothetical protein
MQKFCKVFYNSLKYRFCPDAYFSFLRFCVFVFVFWRKGFIDFLMLVTLRFCFCYCFWSPPALGTLMFGLVTLRFCFCYCFLAISRYCDVLMLVYGYCGLFGLIWAFTYLFYSVGYVVFYSVGLCRFLWCNNLLFYSVQLCHKKNPPIFGRAIFQDCVIVSSTPLHCRLKLSFTQLF